MRLVPQRVLASLLLAGVFFSSPALGEETLVTCGSAIKLEHVASKYNLHSHEIAYGSGSGQQSVTGYNEGADNNDIWLVKGALDADCVQGTPIKSGTAVRLQHAATRRWLHSHHFASPISNEQEVSAFGGDGESDHLDAWTVVCAKAGAAWARDAKVKLKHVETGVYLASSADRRYSRPIAGQQEIYGRKKPDFWMATEGVYHAPPSAVTSSE